jgi:hypothetical protein
MKRVRKQRCEPFPGASLAARVGRNPQLPAQTRKVMRAHYAAKYRTR